MNLDTPKLDDLFDRREEFPNMDAARRFHSLVGIDDAKSRITKLLAGLVNPNGPREWAKNYQPKANVLLSYLERRPPLVVLAGDVGTGKTALAETVGDAVAKQEKIPVTLYPLSLATRGTGKVGEMTKLLSAAFEEVITAAKKLKNSNGKAGGGIIMLIDEADAVTQSREASQMHHEDRAGVNAFIRGVDRLAEQHLPVAIILCTNRIKAIDPAVMRRAAEVFEFGRPNDIQRKQVLEDALKEAAFTDANIADIVHMTGEVGTKEKYGFTYSDLTQRLLPTLVMDAYPDKKITVQRTKEIVAGMRPTPPFKEG